MSSASERHRTRRRRECVGPSPLAAYRRDESSTMSQEPSPATMPKRQSEFSDSPRPGSLSENSDCIVVSGPGHLQRTGDLLHVHAEREQRADAESVGRQGLVKQQFARQFKVRAALPPWRRPRVAGHPCGYRPADDLIRASAVAVPDWPAALDLDGQRRPVAPMRPGRARCPDSRRFWPSVQRVCPVVGDAVLGVEGDDAGPCHPAKPLLARRVRARSEWDNEHAP